MNIVDAEAKVKKDELTWVFWEKDREPQKQTPSFLKVAKTPEPSASDSLCFD